jgi:hypothetical protein
MAVFALPATDSSCHPVHAFDAGAALVRVELGGVFQVGDAPHTGFLRHPALVPYVPVPAALIGRHDDLQRLRRGPLRRLQPGAAAAVPLDVAARLLGADLWQPGPPGPEHRQLSGRRAEPPAPVPPGLGSLPQVGIRLAPRPRRRGFAPCEASPVCTAW